jgi:hypothetical protein
MRTTLTLDPDVAAHLERLRKERRRSMRDLVNEALRVGLRYVENPPEELRRYATRSESLGGCLLPSVDDVADALALGEGEEFR